MKKPQSGNGFQIMGLSQPMLKAISYKGYRVPTPVQRQAIPALLDGRDVVAMARTGSGKTAAFVIPLIEKLREHSAQVGIRGLILSPSRELALQTLKVVKELSRGTTLRSALLVGGDSMEDQFTVFASNPDIVVATPGRLLHLLVEMNISLKTVEFLVFDEADRLFEMGFAEQLHEILHRLPTSRQTSLFSATMPKLLVDFTRAGLVDPVLVRLDSEATVSQDLQTVFFNVKAEEKESALLFLLEHFVQKEQQTIVFVATKHQVEYLQELLSHVGIPNTYIYGSLDQEARKMNISAFRNKEKNILIVTDVAARGIDIPLLDNVINFDFPASPKIFIHRAGRTARAGRPGTAYSLVTLEDVPYYLDMILFIELQKETMIGRIPTVLMSGFSEQVTMAHQNQSLLDALKDSSCKGYKLYNKTKSQASRESHLRAKDMVKQEFAVHPQLLTMMDKNETEHIDILSSISKYRPKETVFEFGKNLNQPETMTMKVRRMAVSSKIRPRSKEEAVPEIKESIATSENNKYRDENFYISHAGTEIAKERGMSVNQNSSDSILTRLNNASVDLMGDDSNSIFKAKSAKYWDSKKHKFVTPTVGADNKKLIKTESGIRIPASYQSNRFEEWQKKTKIHLPSAGQSELGNAKDFIHKGRRFRHKGSEKGPEEEDQDYQKARRVGNVKNARHEIQRAEQIQKKRKIEARKKEKNARQSRKKTRH